MMTTKNSVVIAVMLLTTIVIVGCREKPAIASPTCADVGKVTDLVLKAELQKRCGRGGPDFKPSPEKKW